MNRVQLFLTALSFASLCPLTVAARSDNSGEPTATSKDKSIIASPTKRDPGLGEDRRKENRGKPASQPASKPEMKK